MIIGLDAFSKHNENIHALSYSVGGLSDIHTDVLNNSLVVGDRLLTWLMYLNDVEAGGATVFPKHNVASYPRKYSALFWYNLMNSGDMDPDMWHAGCPVLFGEKWVARKPLKFKGQSRDKCSLGKKFI